MKMNILVFSAYQSFRPDVTVSLMLFFALQHIFDIYSTTQMIFVKSSHISRVIAPKDSEFFFLFSGIYSFLLLVIVLRITQYINSKFIYAWFLLCLK